MGVDGFAGRDRRVQGGGDLRLAFVVVADDGFLEPGQVQILHHAADADGLLDRHLLVGIDHQRSLVAEQFPHETHTSNVVFD